MDSLYSFYFLDNFIDYVNNKDVRECSCHFKINTGLNRVGFSEVEISEAIEKIKNCQPIKLVGIYSHLAATDDINETKFTDSQIVLFEKISSEIKSQTSCNPILHMSNTSGIFNYPRCEFDMVRCGIGLYGFSNIIEEQRNFTPIATLKTVISQIHHIHSGESIGYNRSFKSTSAIVTATLPIGHADGISRSYGNGKGWVWVHGKKAPIIGNVCMDMLMIEITTIDCKEGDEVIVFGAENSIENLTDSINSISYELLTAISQRVKRVFYRN